MGYDSIKKRVTDYSKKKTDVDEEDFILSKDELQIDSIIRGTLLLDSELQQRINTVHNEYVLERSRIDTTKGELEAEKKEMGMLAICTGTGLSDIFKDLAVDRIIEGGQTMNPSANDIADAAKKINRG